MDAVTTRDRRSSLVAAGGVVGGASVSTGAVLPWLSVFEGLRSYSGILGSNGRALAAGGLALVIVALLYGLWPRVLLRYAIGVLGFGLSAFCAYLLAQLLTTYRQLDGEYLPAIGPGLIVASAGALLTVATLLIPGGALARTGPLRALGWPQATLATLSAGAGAIHLAVASEHYAVYPLYGVFFIVLGISQVAWACVAISGASRALMLAAALNLFVVAVWVVSRTTGMPIGPEPGAPESVGLPDVVATAFEMALGGCGLWFLGGRRGERDGPWTTARLLGWVLPPLVMAVGVLAVLTAGGVHEVGGA
jgi:hypothetical protein